MTTLANTQLVMWMPALCHKLQVPYAIVRTKADLGKITHMKTCSCLAFTEIRPEDAMVFDKILAAVGSEVDYERAAHVYGGVSHAEGHAEAHVEEATA